MSPRIAALSLLPLAALLASSSDAQIAVRNQGYIPYSDAPIFYRSDDIDDPVARLQKQVEQGKAQLVHDGGQHGYLKSVLELLDIPISSQTLVFSKTSFQYPKISPEHPRALYFNDDVYVGVVHDGKEVELVSFDARQGAIFYLLHEQRAEQPAFERAELDCTQCHIAAGTRGIPGVLLRSVRPTTTGTLVSGAPSFITDQDSPLQERWGGWYVTGKLASETLANAVSTDAVATNPPKLVPPEKQFNPSAYLAPGSDAVALLVLGHQTQMHNLITLTNYKTRIALHAFSTSAAGTAQAGVEEAALPEGTRRQFERPAEQLLRYLLFAKEAPLGNLDGKQVIESSLFAREFAARGPRDSKGRSLRDFDLSTRTFRYPCSYLIYSEAFDALPEPSRSYVYDRLLKILSGADQDPDFQSLSAQDRRAILEILLETKAGLPPQWLEYARAQGLRVVASQISNNQTSSSHRGKRK
ncbi:hypothetical protein [Steroidobacter sp.]|uniref:hypothetical protein n=1 Tax=Steroidobacter sp. TaxID=1978227 RepID=UPI001A58E2F5|nr:hypothetical protein [Steroidobacter sp.]MBL8271212.1 hypothetical protein [Steroidobacter sp.]